ncbi:MAG: hypothetical protein OXH57_06410 [Ekhidna sp.]|nr:hypothetical protein [Ekhidna sp.]
MKIRKIAYNISYYHILTFSQEYRFALAPFFKLPNLQYQFENRDTFEEVLRLIFMNDHFAISCNKDGMAMVYEGDESALTSSSAPIDTIFDVYNAITGLKGFVNTTAHQIQISSTTKHDKPPMELKNINDSSLLKTSPFPKLKEFAVVYDTKEGNDMDIKATIGSFDNTDIVRFDLAPFKTAHNNDLSESQGYMMEVTVNQLSDNLNTKKFKQLLGKAVEVSKNLESCL